MTPKSSKRVQGGESLPLLGCDTADSQLQFRRNSSVFRICARSPLRQDAICAAIVAYRNPSCGATMMRLCSRARTDPLPVKYWLISPLQQPSCVNSDVSSSYRVLKTTRVRAQFTRVSTGNSRQSKPAISAGRCLPDSGSVQKRKGIGLKGFAQRA